MDSPRPGARPAGAPRGRACFLVSLGIGAFLVLCASCEEPQTDWTDAKNAARPVVALTEEFGEPRPLELACGGWEDGLYVSRDGLTLYCIYAPADLLGHIVNGDDLGELHRYMRGPEFGMDLSNPDPSLEWRWLHTDLLISERSTTEEPFPTWRLSRMARPIFSEGAPQAVYAADGSIDWFVFTSNQTENNEDDVWVIRRPERDPSGPGKPLPSPINTDGAEDNPHMERIDEDSLVLFFDSQPRPGGAGGLDLWFSTSGDDGKTWAKPRPVASLNSSQDDHQPHLFRSGDEWHLYYSGALADGRSGILRARQARAGEWGEWTDVRLVVERGGAAAIGEASLTSDGDLYFAVLSENRGGTRWDRFDCDPWVVPRR